MGGTPDRDDGEALEEGIVLDDRGPAGDNAGPPTEAGQIRFVTGQFLGHNGTTVLDLGATAGGGITESQHKVLRNLIHFIDEGPGEGFTSGATKTITGGLFPTSVLWRDAAGFKLVEKLITRSGGGATNLKPTPIKWKIYDGVGDASGNVLFTISDAITYSGAAEASRVRTISLGDA